MATINDRAANQRRYTDEPPRRNDRVTFLAAIGAAFVATVGFGVALTETFVGSWGGWFPGSRSSGPHLPPAG